MFYLATALVDSCPGGLLHLIDRLGGGAAVTGPFSDGTAAPPLLGQFLFQLSCHDTASPMLDRLSVLALALIFDLVVATAFFYFSYNIASQKKTDTPEKAYP